MIVEAARTLKRRRFERRAAERDSSRFNTATASSQVSRTLVAQSFGSFETPRWRENYVDWLVEQGVVVPQDEWPSGRPPNFNDAASTKLAQLEHRWRGFEK